jgi:hypothetical protein
MMWEVLATIGGATLVLVALRDIFDTLFHPHGQGIVSERLIHGIWRAARRVGRRNHSVLSFAGPVAFFAVILTWSALVIVGFAVMLWPHFPEDYVFTAGAAQDGGLGDALYLSLVNLTSLGYGDIVPATTGLRYLGPLETLIGLGLVTASISWILILYRVLADSRTLSDEIAVLTETQREAGVTLNQIAPEAAARDSRRHHFTPDRCPRRPRSLPNRLLLPSASEEAQPSGRPSGTDCAGRRLPGGLRLTRAPIRGRDAPPGDRPALSDGQRGIPPRPSNR